MTPPPDFPFPGQRDAYPTDQALVAGLLAGEYDAPRAFLERHGPAIYAMVTREFGCDQAVARDLLQELYLHLYEDDWRRLRLWSGRGSLAGYLRTIARRLLLARLERENRPPPENDAPGHEDARDESPATPGTEPAAEIDRAALAACVRRAMDRLQPRERRLIHRLHWEEQSYREIAEAEGMTVSNVGVALHRAQKRLADWVERLCAELVAALAEVGD